MKITKKFLMTFACLGAFGFLTSVNAKVEKELCENASTEIIGQQQKSIKKIVGTYKFAYTKNDGSLWNCPPIVVLEDGRCVIVYGTMGGGKSPKYLGKVTPISDSAFKLSGEYADFTMDVTLYNQGERYGSTKAWNTYKVVFDIKEGRLYQLESEYRNRDIGRALYTTMTHSSSTSY